MRRTETPKPIWIKVCVVVDIPDAVTYTNFGDHRLRCLWVAGGQISPFPINFHRRPYNTRTTVRVCDEQTGSVIKCLNSAQFSAYFQKNVVLLLMFLITGYGCGKFGENPSTGGFRANG